MPVNQFGQQTCCYCFEIDRGMQVLGWLILGNCGIIALESLYFIFQGYMVGFIHLGINSALFILGFFYVKWFLKDTIETRQRVKLGLLIWMVFTMCGLALVFIIILSSDPKKLPVSLRILDEEIWPGKDKAANTMALIMTFTVVATAIFSLQFYLYYMSKRWVEVLNQPKLVPVREFKTNVKMPDIELR